MTIGKNELKSGFERKLNICSLNSDNELFAKNKIKDIRFKDRPGIYFDKKGFRLVPGTILGKHAVVILSAKDYLTFMEKANPRLPCGLDTEVAEAPEIGQRRPNVSRKIAIRNSWANSTITPNMYVEHIQAYVFNAVVDAEGIHFDQHTLTCISDGGGRSDTLYGDISRTAEKHGIIFQISFDLNGEKSRMLQTFRKQNDAKRLNAGTMGAVTNALISEKEHIPTNYDDPLFANWIARKMFNEYRTEGSLLMLCRWKTEAGSMNKDLSQGKGDYTSIVTACKSLKDHIKKSGFTVEQLPEVLDFGFRWFYKNCEESRRDAIENQGSNYHFHATLAFKVIILITLKLHEVANGDEETFGNLVNKTLTQYFKHHQSDFSNSKLKKMRADYLFIHNIYFNSKGFNSGEVASGNIIKYLIQSADDVLQMNAK